MRTCSEKPDPEALREGTHYAIQNKIPTTLRNNAVSAVFKTTRFLMTRRMNRSIRYAHAAQKRRTAIRPVPQPPLSGIHSQSTMKRYSANAAIRNAAIRKTDQVLAMARYHVCSTPILKSLVAGDWLAAITRIDPTKICHTHTEAVTQSASLLPRRSKSPIAIEPLAASNR